jgi:hypothetical protein
MDPKNNRNAPPEVITDKLWRALGKGFETIDDAKQALTRRLVK